MIQTLTIHEAGTSIPGSGGTPGYGIPSAPIPGTGIAVWTGGMPVEYGAPAPGIDTYGPPKYTPAPSPPLTIPVQPQCSGCGGGGTGLVPGGGATGPAQIPIGGGNGNRFAPNESNTAAGQRITEIRDVPWWIWLALAVGVWGLYGRERNRQ